MNVLYSIGATLGGGGLGTTAYHGVRGLYRHGMLHRALCGAYRGTQLPLDRVRTVGMLDQLLRKLAIYDRSHWLAHLQTIAFDHWAARHLEPADLFLVWYKCGLRSMERAKRMGMVTVSQWGNVHPRAQYRSLAEEFERWGIRRRMPRAVLARALAEIERADYLIVPTEMNRESFLGEGVPDRKLLTIHNGVDVQRFRPPPARLAHPFRALFVGQVGFRKGIPYLLQAWQQLGWHDAELWLAGNVDAEIRPLVARFTDLPGLRSLGYASEPVRLYQAADVFVFPSLQEGSAKVTFEAMACGLPLVTTPDAGPAARDSEEGLIVPARDVSALATALESLRSNEPLRRRMGAAARARAECFSWERHGDVLAQALIGTHRGAGSAIQRREAGEWSSPCASQ